ncbi:unnamed protein product [Coregonus sp. 'balchen']|nr:unnamed protein product [Coregonus sp. 'balchen']
MSGLNLTFSWLQCGDPFKEENLVVLNGTKEEVEKLREKMEEKRAKAKATKSDSKALPGPPGSSSSSKVVTPLAATGSKRSIQTMEEKSETYKSLFTSHSSAKRTKAQTSNWVTHTPYHF